MDSGNAVKIQTGTTGRTDPGLADLHMHSTHSDGIYTPRQLIGLVARAGVGTIALTDHDTLRGLPEMAALAAEQGIGFIPGVELSTRCQERQVHILGYGIVQNNDRFLTRIAEVRDARRIRLAQIRDRLWALGLNVEVPVPAEGQRAVGRPHVAQALLEQGYVKNYQEAFDLYLGEGRPAYIPQPKMTPSEALELIHGAGGLAVQAHPEEIGDRKLALELLRSLPYDGLEIWHPSVRRREQQEFWLHAATEQGLLVTGGSDFHGHKTRFPERMEDWPVQRQQAHDFLNRFGV